MPWPYDWHMSRPTWQWSAQRPRRCTPSCWLATCRLARCCRRRKLFAAAFLLPLPVAFLLPAASSLPRRCRRSDRLHHSKRREESLASSGSLQRAAERRPVHRGSHFCSRDTRCIGGAPCGEAPPYKARSGSQLRRTVQISELGLSGQRCAHTRKCASLALQIFSLPGSFGTFAAAPPSPTSSSSYSLGPNKLWQQQ